MYAFYASILESYIDNFILPIFKRVAMMIILGMSCLTVDTGYDTHIYGFFPWDDRESRLYGYNDRKHDRKCDWTPFSASIVLGAGN